MPDAEPHLIAVDRTLKSGLHESVLFMQNSRLLNVQAGKPS